MGHTRSCKKFICWQYQDLEKTLEIPQDLGIYLYDVVSNVFLRWHYRSRIKNIAIAIDFPMSIQSTKSN